ncbi:hypothetical protein RJ641_014844 [Dillenia turbinata]|uniref:Uncharacterized protein n=1 Tax=Dillenia turbinata TaxID=194707 RepID=A0AAN8Z1K1_9MAGN
MSSIAHFRSKLPMGTQENKPFLVDRKDIVFVKPSKTIPQEILLLSSIDNDPTSEYHGQTIQVYRSNDFESSRDPVCLIKEALSKVLVFYYPLAGKLKRFESDGRLRLCCNAGDGVPFLEAGANCKLSSLHYLEGIDISVAKHLVFDPPNCHTDGDGGGNYYSPLLIQLTRFSCGGFTIGMSLSHSVCDGYGAAQFFGALTEVASGKSEPTVKPVWERHRLSASTPEEPVNPFGDKDSLATSPHLPASDIVHEFFNVSSERIKRLKEALMITNGNADKVVSNESYTSFEVLGAYLWRAKFRALEMNLDGYNVLSFTKSIRHHLTPPLPDGYYGNSFADSNVIMTGRDLTEGPLSRVVKMIKSNKSVSFNNESIMTLLRNKEWLVEQKVKSREARGAWTFLTDWRQLGLIGEVDFGWKASVNMIPLPFDCHGFIDLCILMNPCSLDFSMKGGARVFVSFPRACMAKFKEEIEVLRRKRLRF